MVDYVNVRVPTNFKEDSWVQAAEAVPGDRSVVHHIIVYVLGPRTRRRPGENHLCGYAPGDMPSVYPPGIAKKIPAGLRHPASSSTTRPTARSAPTARKLGLIFAKAPVEHEAHTLRDRQQTQRSRSRRATRTARSSRRSRLEKDIYLLGFMPHMHLRGKDFQYTLVPKDGPPEVLLSVPGLRLRLAELLHPRPSPASSRPATRIDCVAHFDNSKDNPANPDPSKAVTWGDQTFEEMMIGYIDYYDAAPSVRTPSASRDAAAKPTSEGSGGR